MNAQKQIVAKLQNIMEQNEQNSEKRMKEIIDEKKQIEIKLQETLRKDTEIKKLKEEVTLRELKIKEQMAKIASIEKLVEELEGKFNLVCKENER